MKHPSQESFKTICGNCGMKQFNLKAFDEELVRLCKRCKFEYSISDSALKNGWWTKETLEKVGIFKPQVLKWLKS